VWVQLKPQNVARLVLGKQRDLALLFKSRDAAHRGSNNGSARISLLGRKHSNEEDRSSLRRARKFSSAAFAVSRWANPVSRSLGWFPSGRPRRADGLVGAGVVIRIPILMFPVRTMGKNFSRRLCLFGRKEFLSPAALVAAGTVRRTWRRLWRGQTRSAARGG
jgi:hypothetical protein